jgi:hypothetical protein
MNKPFVRFGIQEAGELRTIARGLKEVEAMLPELNRAERVESQSANWYWA